MNTPKNDFVTVAELAEGFSEYALKPNNEWVNQELNLYLENGSEIFIQCLDINVAYIKFNETATSQHEFSTTYNMLKIRENLFFIDFIIPGHILKNGQPLSFSAVINSDKKIAKVILGILPSKEEYGLSTFYRASQNLPITAVKIDLLSATLNRPWSNESPVFEKTDQLIGKKILFRYSENDLYQHTYLNNNFYTWECLEGIEAGLCDTDKCFFHDLENNIFLFTWIEKIIPTIGIVIEDLNNHRSHGKIYGYTGYESGQVTNFLVGSYAEIVN